MKYQIVAANSHDALVEDVNTALADGWALQGGVTFGTWEDSRGDGHVLYAQAMVKA